MTLDPLGQSLSDGAEREEEQGSSAEEERDREYAFDIHCHDPPAGLYDPGRVNVSGRNAPE